MKTLENILKPVKTGLLVGAITIAGCSIPNPKPGTYPTKKNVALLTHPIVALYDGGTQYIKKIGGRTPGFLISKKPWYSDKRTKGTTIALPRGAENIGLEIHERFTTIHYWISFELDGEKKVNKYEVGSHGKYSVLLAEYNWDKKKKKFNKVKREVRRSRAR